MTGGDRQVLDSGDTGAPDGGDLESLYRLEHPAMLKLARLLLGSNSLAEEVVQEAFTRLHGRVGRLDSPGGYLRTTVVNICRDELRRTRRERQQRPATVGTSLPPEIDETWMAVCRLPFRQRAVLTLRFYEDLPESEIARLLNCRLGTVKSALHRGLAKLRKELS